MEMFRTNEQIQVTLSGNIYVEDAAKMREALTSLIGSGHTSLLIDLSRVEYIDSTGLGMLVFLQKQAVKKGGSIRLKGLQGIVKELFELTRLSTVFETA